MDFQGIIKRKLQWEIKDSLGFFPIVGIIGPRQVGKTTLVKDVQATLDFPCQYLDLELDEDMFKLQNPQQYLERHSDKCVIIDEIQRKPDLFPLLRALVDKDRRPARFIILGSASPEMVRFSSESLAGRIAYLELCPLSLIEIQDYPIGQEKHWFRGGFPPALLAPEDRFSRLWLQNFVFSFLERDVRELGYEINVQTMERLLRMLAHTHGALLNVSDLSRALGISAPTINKYLDILEGGFLIRRLQPYFVNLGKRLVKSPKVFIRDSGLLHYLSSVLNMESLYGNPVIGASWEGYCIEQLDRESEYRSWEFYFYRTHAGAGTDLVLISPSGKKLCVEIKNSNTPKLSKGFYSSLEDLKPDAAFVLTPSSDVIPQTHGITVCSLLHFLKEELPKFQI